MQSGGFSDEFDPLKIALHQADATWQGKKYTLLLTKFSIRVCKLGFPAEKPLSILSFTDVYSVQQAEANKNQLDIYACLVPAPLYAPLTLSISSAANSVATEQNGAAPSPPPLAKREISLVFDDETTAATWLREIDLILNGPQDQRRQRRMLVFVNPFSGSGKSIEIWKEISEVFDRTTTVQYRLQETERARQALEMCRDLDPNDYDTIVCCSGDGLLWEVVNGLCSRRDWRRALQIYLGIIPAGSGNGLAHSIGCHCPLRAIMSIVKGTHRPIDLWTVDQGGKKTYAFLSLTWCLIGDIDIESENLRWMGDTRFTVGAVKRVLNLRKYSGRISYLPADSSTTPTTRCGYYCTCKYFEPGETDPGDDNERGGPKVKFSSTDRSLEDEWETYEGQLTFFVAANASMIAGSTYASPFAHCSDGYIDLLFLKDNGRISALSVLLDLENGNFVKHKYMEYKKVKAFRVEPTGTHKGIFSLDGERMEQTAILCESHRGLLHFFCPKP